MKTYQPADIRNFAIVGHASSGKTMLSEAMLMCGGVISRMGRIADGSTASDYHVSEKNRQISVSASLLHTEWMGKKFNIIDTPGYLDFISEGLGALRVGDFALVVVHAQHGLGVGTERVWDYATGYGIPKMIVVNAVDKENVDFDAVVKTSAGTVRPARFSVECAGESRSRLQPRAGRIAQRNRDLRDRLQRQIQGRTGLPANGRQRARNCTASSSSTSPSRTTN